MIEPIARKLNFPDEAIAQDNSLRRAVIEHLKNGGTMGNGAGILFVDESF